MDIINSPVRRVSTQTIRPYYRMRIIDRYGLVRSVYQDDAIPDNVWTMIAGEFCSITSSGRRYCSININARPNVYQTLFPLLRRAHLR